MAKKKSTKNKHYPTVLSTQAGIAVVPSNTKRLLQADRFLSKMNRRLYRMGRYYEMKIDIDNDGLDQIEVFALRDDWAVQKAFQLAYAEYVRNIADEKATLSDNQQARWRDFRVSPGTAADVSDLVPEFADTDGNAVRLTSGNFELAEVVDGSGSTRTFTWNPTPSGSQYGILTEYDRMADAQASPENSSAPGPYENIDTERDAATYAHLEEDGANPPYDRNTVNQASPFVRVASLGGTNGVQKLSTGFFTAPCGIVLITGVTESGDKISVTFKKGDYKGVHAPSMLE